MFSALTFNNPVHQGLVHDWIDEFRYREGIIILWQPVQSVSFDEICFNLDRRILTVCRAKLIVGLLE